MALLILIMAHKYTRLLILLVSIHTAPALLAQDNLADLKDEPQVKELRLQAAIKAAQLELDAIDAKAVEAKLRAEVTQAELAASLAGHQATIATKEKSIRESLFGATVSPLDGTIEAKSKAEAYVIASQQLDRLGREIAAELRSRCPLSKGSNVFLVGGEPDENLGSMIRSYDVVTKRIGAVSSGLTKRTNDISSFILHAQNRRPVASAESSAKSFTDGGIGALSAPSLIQAGLSLATLFRTNRDFSSVEMSFEDSALVAAVADHLIGYPPPENVSDHYSGKADGGKSVKILPRLNVYSSMISVGESTLLKDYSGLYSSQILLEVELTKLADLENKLKKDKADVTKKIADYEAVIKAGKAAAVKVKEAVEAVSTLEKKEDALKAATNTASKKANEAKEANETAVQAAKDAAAEKNPVEKKTKQQEAENAKTVAEEKEKAADEAKNAAKALSNEVKAAKADVEKTSKEAKTAKEAADEKAEEAGTTLADVKLALENGQLQLAKTGDDLTLLAVHRANAAKSTAASTAELSQFAAGTVDETSMADLLKAEYLRNSWSKAGSYVVFVDINLVGGTNLTSRNLLTNSLRVGGGVSASYHALNSECQTVAAGTVYGYSGFYKVPTKSRGPLPSSMDEPEHAGEYPQKEKSNRRKRLGHPARRR